MLKTDINPSDGRAEDAVEWSFTGWTALGKVDMDIASLHLHLHVNGEWLPFYTVAVDMVFKCVYSVWNGLNMTAHQLL